MKITDVSVFKVDASWRNWVFLRIDTDVALVGFGECSLEGREHAVEGAVKDLSRSLMGADPRRIRSLVHLMTDHGYWESGPVISSAIGGIEMALWDLVAKSYDAPLSEILGGPVRESVRAYSNAWYFGSATPEEFADRAVETVAQGFTALKFDPFGECEFVLSAEDLHKSFAKVEAVREATGPAVDLLIEGHGRLCVESAVRFGKLLERIDSILFFEEPVPSGDVRALRRVAQAIKVPVAAGERWYEARTAQEAINLGAIGVAQPDVIHIGGIGRLLDVARMCATARIPVAPHNASGPIACAATLQAAAVLPNVSIQEMFAPEDAPWRDTIATPPIRIVDGEVKIPQGPGLGIDLSEDAVSAHGFVARDLALYNATSVLNRSVDPTADPTADSQANQPKESMS